ncbi:MAG: hypothetical protein HC877_23960 [Thioploca sp.]|nr:hypothetical protein [Thioploca sp.]
MTVGFDTFFQKNFPVQFIVKNITNKKIRIFNYPLLPGQQTDLMAIPYVSEPDIKASILKGEIKSKLDTNDISVTASNIDLTSFDPAFVDYLTNDLGITVGVTPTSSSDEVVISSILEFSGTNWWCYNIRT